MRRLSLSTLLIAVNVALVALAVICVVVPAVGLMRRLADEDGIARVRLAGAGAMQAVERSESEAATAARLLGARPTLLRLVRQGDAAEASRFLGEVQRGRRPLRQRRPRGGGRLRPRRSRPAVERARLPRGRGRAGASSRTAAGPRPC